MALEGEVAAGLTLHEDTTTGIHGVGAGTIVGTTLTQTLTNKTLTTPVIASLYQDAAKTNLLTMPAATDTLVGKATTDTLTNKTLTSPTINGTIVTTGLTMPAFTLGANVTINGKSFDAGSGSVAITTTGAGQGLAINNTNDDVHGAALILRHTSASPAANDTLGRVNFWGSNSTPADYNWGVFDCLIEVVTAGSEESRLEWTMRLAGAWNSAMKLSGAGGLSVDADIGTADDPVALFDDYDDALILRQGISERQLQVLEKIGVLERKESGSGWMLKIQAMLYLLAGGIYQNRARIDHLTKLLTEGAR